MVRFVGVLLGIVCIVYSIYELSTYSSSDPSDGVRFVYFILYGTLILLAEFRVEHLLEWFAMLKSAGGLGTFYIFVGGNALGRGGAFGYVVFGMAIFTAIFYFIMAASCKEIYYSDEELDDEMKIEWFRRDKSKSQGGGNNVV